MPTKPDLSSILREKLLDWYDQSHRDLPWRSSPSVYKTVVSEFMLQQTQVATVMPFFEKWTKYFPDFVSLACASEAQVLKQWEGLGYYRRARYLHATAQRWVAAARKPASYQEWLEFPGIGPYMAAAIASIAFGEAKAVVDGNVIRVICRLNRFDERFSSVPKAVQKVKPIAEAMIDEKRPGDFNQAMMELGATICRPRSPTCLICPLKDHCNVSTLDCASEIPRIQKAKTVEVARNRLFFVHPSKGLLLSAEETSGRLQGLLELPQIPQEQSPPPKSIGKIRRGIGNERVTEPVYEISDENWQNWVHKKAKPVWVSPHKLSEVILSGPHRKWLSDFLASSGGSY